ncbi:MAG: response regulator [Chloroflexota bacterium]
MRDNRRLSGTRPKIVLLVDDQALIVSLLAWDIERAIPSSRVVIAGNGAEGLRVIRQVRPDVIVTDLMMPEMDGYEMVQNIRRESYGRKIPIIGITGSEQEDGRTIAFRGVCDEFLAKPFLHDELINKVLWLMSAGS